MIDLQLAQKRWNEQPERARGLVDDALEHAQAAIDDLRDLAAGIHPAVLTDRGLVGRAGDAGQPLAGARSSSTPSSTSGCRCRSRRRPTSSSPRRSPTSASTACASHAVVAVRLDGDRLEVEVRDDGIGGADASAGSGLRGLADRVSAMQGRFQVCSPPGRGTRVHARIALS